MPSCSSANMDPEAPSIQIDTAVREIVKAGRCVYTLDARRCAVSSMTAATSVSPSSTVDEHMHVIACAFRELAVDLASEGLSTTFPKILNSIEFRSRFVLKR